MACTVLKIKCLYHESNPIKISNIFFRGTNSLSKKIIQKSATVKTFHNGKRKTFTATDGGFNRSQLSPESIDTQRPGVHLIFTGVGQQK